MQPFTYIQKNWCWRKGVSHFLANNRVKWATSQNKTLNVLSFLIKKVSLWLKCIIWSSKTFLFLFLFSADSAEVTVVRCCHVMISKNLHCDVTALRSDALCNRWKNGNGWKIFQKFFKQKLYPIPYNVYIWKCYFCVQIALLW